MVGDQNNDTIPERDVCQNDEVLPLLMVLEIRYSQVVGYLRRIKSIIFKPY